MEWSSRLSYHAELDHALAELTEHLQEHPDPDLLILFASAAFADRFDELSLRLEQAWPACHVFGSSADGVIANGEEAEFTPALAWTAGWLPSVQIQSFAVTSQDLPGPDAPPEAWRERLGLEGPELAGILLLVDPFTFEPEPLLAGLDYAYPKTPKLGGLVSGGRGAGGNALFSSGSTLRQGALGLALSGSIQMTSVVAQGCKPIGQPMVISDCHDYLLKTLDRRPALEVLTGLLESLDRADRQLARHSLFLGVGMGQPRLQYGPGDFLVRNILGFDLEAPGIAVGARLRVGQTVQFHLRDASTSTADLEHHLDSTPLTPTGALMFSCLGRGQGLYRRPHHDSSLVRKRFPDLPLAGFFCNGEIGPVGGTTYLHGYTTCLALLH